MIPADVQARPEKSSRRHKFSYPFKRGAKEANPPEKKRDKRTVDNRTDSIHLYSEEGNSTQRPTLTTTQGRKSKFSVPKVQNMDIGKYFRKQGRDNGTETKNPELGDAQRNPKKGFDVKGYAPETSREYKLAPSKKIFSGATNNRLNILNDLGTKRNSEAARKMRTIQEILDSRYPGAHHISYVKTPHGWSASVTLTHKFQNGREGRGEFDEREEREHPKTDMMRFTSRSKEEVTNQLLDYVEFFPVTRNDKDFEKLLNYMYGAKKKTPARTTVQYSRPLRSTPGSTQLLGNESQRPSTSERIGKFPEALVLTKIDNQGQYNIIVRHAVCGGLVKSSSKKGAIDKVYDYVHYEFLTSKGQKPAELSEGMNWFYMKLIQTSDKEFHSRVCYQRVGNDIIIRVIYNMVEELIRCRRPSFDEAIRDAYKTLEDEKERLLRGKTYHKSPYVLYF